MILTDPRTETASKGWSGHLGVNQANLINRQLYEESLDPPGPEHIVAPVLYLSTDQAANFNGQVIGSSRGRVVVYTWPTEAKGIYKDGIWTLDELVRIEPAIEEESDDTKKAPADTPARRRGRGKEGEAKTPTSRGDS